MSKDLEVKPDNTPVIIEPQEQGILDMMSITDLQKFNEEAQKRIDIVDAMRNNSLRITKTNPVQCWSCYGGKNYRLTDVGAEKIRQLWGLSVETPTFEKTPGEDEKGKYYFYTCQATIVGKMRFGAVGNCSSRDKLWAWDKTNRCYKALSEITEHNVKQKSYTNMLVNGISKFLGIQYVTADMLKQAGVDIGLIPQLYEDKKGESGAGQGSSYKPEPPSEPQVKLIDGLKSSHLLKEENWKEEKRPLIREILAEYKPDLEKNTKQSISFVLGKWIGTKENQYHDGQRFKLEKEYKEYGDPNYAKNAPKEDKGTGKKEAEQKQAPTGNPEGKQTSKNDTFNMPENTSNAKKVECTRILNELGFEFEKTLSAYYTGKEWKDLSDQQKLSFVAYCKDKEKFLKK